MRLSKQFANFAGRAQSCCGRKTINYNTLAIRPEAKPTEIHNHFEGGSTAQVFNDQVTGRFSKIKKWRIEKCEKKKKKRENTKREKRKAS